MKKLKLLFDLKPALDGYSGIPQEARLLFRVLQSLGDNFQTDGLLQHPHDMLVAPAADEASGEGDRIIQTSRVVASFDAEHGNSRWMNYRRTLRHLARLWQFRARAYRDRPVALAHFDSLSFGDFLWRRLFDKTLRSEDKETVLSARYRLVAEPRNLFHLVSLSGLSQFHEPRPLLLDTKGYDAVLAQTPFPAQVTTGTRLIVRYHDAVPIFLPHTINAKQLHQALHYQALKQNVEAGAVFACCSASTRADLVRVFPQLERRSVTIHNIVSNTFSPESVPKQHALAVIANRRYLDAAAVPAGTEGMPSDYILMVSTLEPRKNHALLIAAWERLQLAGFPDLALVLVGAKGWLYEPIEDMMRSGMRRGQLFHLTNVPARELGMLYQHASVTVCPSFSEGFDYTGVEAMRCGGLVAASDIAVHREVYGDGATYFDPYSEDELASTLSRLLGEGGGDERAMLKNASREVANRYTTDAILPQWREFLTMALKV